jgi:hypothetical protein
MRACVKLLKRFILVAARCSTHCSLAPTLSDQNDPCGVSNINGWSINGAHCPATRPSPTGSKYRPQGTSPPTATFLRICPNSVLVYGKKPVDGGHCKRNMRVAQAAFRQEFALDFRDTRSSPRSTILPLDSANGYLNCTMHDCNNSFNVSPLHLSMPRMLNPHAYLAY